MSIALWNELQAAKVRIEALENRLHIPSPQPDALANLLARLEALELSLRKGKR